MAIGRSEESRTANGDGTKVTGSGPCAITVDITSGSGTFAVNENVGGNDKPVDDAGVALSTTADRTWMLNWPEGTTHEVWVTVSGAASLESIVRIEFQGEPPLQ